MLSLLKHLLICLCSLNPHLFKLSPKKTFIFFILHLWVRHRELWIFHILSECSANTHKSRTNIFGRSCRVDSGLTQGQRSARTLETKRAGKVLVSGVISGLSFVPVFTFSQHLLTHPSSPPHRWDQYSVSTEVRGRRASLSMLTKLEPTAEIRPAAVSVRGRKQMQNLYQKRRRDSLVWAAEIVIK